MEILECNSCGYQRSSEQDGRSFEEDDLFSEKLICSFCKQLEKAKAELLANGKTVLPVPEGMKPIIATLE